MDGSQRDRAGMKRAMTRQRLREIRHRSASIAICYLGLSLPARALTDGTVRDAAR